MQKRIRIRFIRRQQPDLAKLARALIRFAQEQEREDTSEDRQRRAS